MARLEVALGARLYKTEDRVKAHLGKGGETVCGAACIGHYFVLCGIIELLVDSHDKHLSVRGWSGDDDALSPVLHVCTGLQAQKPKSLSSRQMRTKL